MLLRPGALPNPRVVSLPPLFLSLSCLSLPYFSPSLSLCLCVSRSLSFVLCFQAVCCSDREHCCPQGTTCDMQHLRCDSDSGSQPWLTKHPATPVLTGKNEFRPRGSKRSGQYEPHCRRGGHRRCPCGCAPNLCKRTTHLSAECESARIKAAAVVTSLDKRQQQKQPFCSKRSGLTQSCRCRCRVPFEKTFIIADLNWRVEREFYRG